LSARELEVLRLVAAGAPNRAIARQVESKGPGSVASGPEDSTPQSTFE
jgi:hypothetical protein